MKNLPKTVLKLCVLAPLREICPAVVFVPRSKVVSRKGAESQRRCSASYLPIALLQMPNVNPIVVSADDVDKLLVLAAFLKTLIVPDGLSVYIFD